MELFEGLADQSSDRVEQVITEVEIEKLTDEIEGDTNFDHIDGKVLSSIVKMVYYCGLCRGNIKWLTLGNIRDNDNKIVEKIDGSSSIIFLLVDTDCKILLSNYVVQKILRPHMEYLRSSGFKYNVGSDDLLFPQKNKSPYNEKALERNLAKFIKNFKFKDIKKTAKGKYFQQIKEGNDLTLDKMMSYRIKIQPEDGIKFQKSIRKRTGNSVGWLCLMGPAMRYIRDHGLIKYLQNIESFIMKLFREITKNDMLIALLMACERIPCFRNMTTGEIKELRDEFFNAVEQQEVFTLDETIKIEKLKADLTDKIKELRDEISNAVKRQEVFSVDESIKIKELEKRLEKMEEKKYLAKDSKTTLKNYFKTGFLINHGIKFDPTTGEPNKGIEEEPPIKGIKKNYTTLLSNKIIKELNTPCQDEEEQKALYEMCKEAKNSAEQLMEYYYGKDSKDDSDDGEDDVNGDQDNLSEESED